MSLQLVEQPLEVEALLGDGAAGALDSAISVPDGAKAFVIDWLREAYGVQLGG